MVDRRRPSPGADARRRELRGDPVCVLEAGPGRSGGLAVVESQVIEVVEDVAVIEGDFPSITSISSTTSTPSAVFLLLAAAWQLPSSRVSSWTSMGHFSTA